MICDFYVFVGIFQIVSGNRSTLRFWLHAVVWCIQRNYCCEYDCSGAGINTTVPEDITQSSW